MRGTRTKKLRAVYQALIDRKYAPADDKTSAMPKRYFRFFKKLYTHDKLINFLPNL